MIKKWESIKKLNKSDFKGYEIGFCYAVRFNVMPGFYLTKIGASQNLNRLSNIPRKKICYVSPPHLNYFENEEKLHSFFKEYRVPRKPGGKSQVELFNIDIPYFLSNLPMLEYEIAQEKCEKVMLPNGGYWYKSKNRDSPHDQAPRISCLSPEVSF